MIYLLHNHTSPETAFMVDWATPGNLRTTKAMRHGKRNSSPLRCKCRFWIQETKARQYKIATQQTVMVFNTLYSSTFFRYGKEERNKITTNEELWHLTNNPAGSWGKVIYGKACEFCILYLDLAVDSKTGELLPTSRMEFDPQNPNGIHEQACVKAASLSKFDPPEYWLQFWERYSGMFYPPERNAFFQAVGVAAEFQTNLWEKFLVETKGAKEAKGLDVLDLFTLTQDVTQGL